MNRDEILDLMLRECDICVHLYGKIPPGGMEFRLSPPQRSTAELLRYLTYIGVAAVNCFVTGSWDPYSVFEKAAETLDPKDFPAAMERQKAGLRAQFAELTEADLTRKRFAMPWGVELALGPAIVSLAYASLVAYRMQLFLQAKAAGNAALGTADCWQGRGS